MHTKTGLIKHTRKVRIVMAPRMYLRFKACFDEIADVSLLSLSLRLRRDALGRKGAGPTMWSESLSFAAAGVAERFPARKLERILEY